ncbi:hypothetical protein TNIN_143231 [Trichonephila inaurata madagascariensis]|uniref:Uncharacterized protein n=1 Tax=Trichonephila inaurata madagascariensis TaxID=2747483 RepID=A0A8X6X1B8_9ARAC|nr:hypothetical protein TNIN_139281 [Trichonephila inaurata madagascariensis]GFY70236.1 hypothetical protein TNIN_143231 [Trichonephila inaurata madagascariensis]
MKTIFFLCCVAVFAVIASSDDSYEINASFFDRAGLSRACYGNQTFTRYSTCDKRCDQMKPPTNCPDVTLPVIFLEKKHQMMFGFRKSNALNFLSETSVTAVLVEFSSLKIFIQY